MQLRVMTYNFLYAFHEREGDTMLFQKERAHAVASVVRGCPPDLLGVTESVYCGGGRGRLIRPDYATMFVMDHVHATGFEGRRSPDGHDFGAGGTTSTCWPVSRTSDALRTTSSPTFMPSSTSISLPKSRPSGTSRIAGDAYTSRRRMANIRI